MQDINKMVFAGIFTLTLGMASSLLPLYGNIPGYDSGGRAGRHYDGEWGQDGGPLRLTKDQHQKMKDAFTVERETIKPLRRELRDAINKLKDQVEDKASDSDLQASMERVSKAEETLRAERQRLRAKINAILTTGQRARALGMNGWGSLAAPTG